jgi:hypothetical protein
MLTRTQPQSVELHSPNKAEVDPARAAKNCARKRSSPTINELCPLSSC